MKKVVLLACLIGIGLLLPTAKVNSSVVNHFCKRVVDVSVEGFDLLCTSQSDDGTITKVEIHQQNPHRIVLTQYCSGYSCVVDLSGLPSGTYGAKVFCANTTYTEVFSL